LSRMGLFGPQRSQRPEAPNRRQAALLELSFVTFQKRAFHDLSDAVLVQAVDADGPCRSAAIGSEIRPAGIERGSKCSAAAVVVTGQRIYARLLRHWL
jgi:hypothetical protein